MSENEDAQFCHTTQLEIYNDCSYKILVVVHLKSPDGKEYKKQTVDLSPNGGAVKFEINNCVDRVQFLRPETLKEIRMFIRSDFVIHRKNVFRLHHAEEPKPSLGLEDLILPLTA